MQRQRIGIKNGKHFTQNEHETHGMDWLLVAGLFGFFALAVTLVWAIGNALGV